jgi:MFS family permease
VSRRGHLLTALHEPGFRRLYGVRLTGQFGDGLFQASLAGAVLFDPQRQGTPADIAAAFAVLLLPYSVVGPFAGVLLDRWWRRRTLASVNVIRAFMVAVVAAEIGAGVSGVGLYATALIVIALSRFFLSGMSAALPHVVPPKELVTANAFATTSGGVATTAGAGAAILLRLLVGSGNSGYAVIAALSAAPYLASAVVTYGFGKRALGPDESERARRESAGAIARGLVAGARHVQERPTVRHALAMITAHRVCYGLWTVCTLLLYRNYFADYGIVRAGVGGLGQLIAMVAVGSGLAAVVTPAASRRLGFGRWPVLLLVLAGAVQAGFGLSFLLPLALLSGLLLGFAAQGIKISVDTLVQYQVDDEYRGRVFALYDMLFNVALVLAAGLTAAALPADGHAAVAFAAIAVIYVLVALAYLRVTTPLRVAALSTSA